MKPIIAGMLFLFMTVNTFGQNFNKGLNLYGENKRSLGETEWTKKMCDGGFYVHIGMILPSKQAYLPLGATNNSSDKYGVGGHLEIGNMVLISEFSDNAIGLRATWLEASITSWSNKDYKSTFVHGSPLRVGPYFTLEVADEVGVDFFYQIGASYCMDLEVDTMPMTGRDNYGYFGFTHNIGAGVRYQMYSFGFDYNLGNMKYTDKEEYKDLPEEFVTDFYKLSTNYLRIYAGFRF